MLNYGVRMANKQDKRNERWGGGYQKRTNERAPHRLVNGWVAVIDEKAININRTHQCTDNS